MQPAVITMEIPTFPDWNSMKHIQPDNMSRDFTKAFSVMRVARNSK